MKISARVRWSRKSRVTPGGGDEATFSSRVLVVTCSCWLRPSPREPRSTNRNLLFIADLRVPWPYRVNKNERERAIGLHLGGYCQWYVRRKKGSLTNMKQSWLVLECYVLVLKIQNIIKDMIRAGSCVTCEILREHST